MSNLTKCDKRTGCSAGIMSFIGFFNQRGELAFFGGSVIARVGAKVLIGQRVESPGCPNDNNEAEDQLPQVAFQHDVFGLKG